MSSVESFVFLQEHVSITIGNYQILILSTVIAQYIQLITDLVHSVTQMDARNLNQMWNEESLNITCLKEKFSSCEYPPDYTTILSFDSFLICDPRNIVWISGQTKKNIFFIWNERIFSDSSCTWYWVLYNMYFLLWFWKQNH